MRTRAYLILAAGALLAAACTNSSGDTATASGGGGPVTSASAEDLSKNVPSTQPGVTDTEIRVASLGAVTNAVGADFGQAPKGAQAYFDMVNSQGGIYGRKLVISEQVDDQMLKNKEEANKIISANNVFAVLPVTAVIFTGAPDLADSGIPTFGWLVGEEWAGPPNFFADRGAVVCISCGIPHLAYTAKQMGAEKVGVVAYGVEQARTCADGVKNIFTTFPVAEVAFVDDTVPFGATDYSVQVQRMKDEDIDLAVACSDSNSAITLAKEIKKQGADTKMFLANGYETDLLANFADAVEGSYVYSSVAPVEMENAPKGLADYKEWIAKVDGAKVGEQSLIGWANAQLFHEGLMAAGPEFTQPAVIDAINQKTDWNADGVVAKVDWTKAHDQPPNPSCAAVIKVEGGKFVPQFGQPGKPFVCVPTEGTLPDPAPVEQ